jgi:hypothetical protein
MRFMTNLATLEVNEDDTRATLGEHSTDKEFRHQLKGLLGRKRDKVDCKSAHPAKTRGRDWWRLDADTVNYTGKGGCAW